MVDTANTIWRDFETDGVPTSGPWRVRKSDERAWGTNIEARLDDADDRIADAEELATTSLRWTSQTIAVRSTANVNLANGLENGDTLNGVTLATGQHVFLGSQTAPAENGIYTVVASGAASRATFADTAAELAHIGFVVQGGTTGTGERWTLPMAAGDITLGSTALAFALTGIEPSYAAEVTTARGGSSSLGSRLDKVDDALGRAEQTVGRAVTPITGSAIVNRVYVWGNAATVYGKVTLFRYFGLGSGTAYLKVFDLIDGNYVQSGSDISVAVTAGAHEAVVDIAIEKGQYVGLYANTLISFTSNTADGVGWRSSANGSGNVSIVPSGAMTTTLRLEAGFRIEGAEIASDTTERLIELSADVASAYTIGRSVDPVTGTGSSLSTFVFGTPAPFSGIIESMRLYALTTGTLHVSVWSKAGNDFTRIGADHLVTITSTGLKTIALSGIEIEAGQYVGYYAPDIVPFTANAADYGGWYSGSGNGASFTDATVATSQRLEIGFNLAGGHEGRITALEAAASDTNAQIAALESAINDLGGDVYTAPTTYYVFSVIGQSNAVGQADDGAPISLPAGLAYMWNGSSLVPLAEPTTIAAQTSGGGAWLAFAREFYRRTGFGVVIVNSAMNGTSIVVDDWADTGPGSHRQDAVDELDAAQVALTAAGYAWQFGGVLLIQGETDGDNIDATTITGSDYTSGLEDLKAFMETETGSGANMPFILSETGRKGSGNTSGWQAIRAAQRQFCRDETNVFLGFTGAYNFYARGLMKDTYHYTRQGYDELGKAMAAVAVAVSVGRC